MASITITDTSMASTSGHIATFDPAALHGLGTWTVSWCPARQFARNYAVTALMIAELATTGATGPTHRKWPRVQAFAAELGMDPDEAVRMVLLSTP